MYFTPSSEYRIMSDNEYPTFVSDIIPKLETCAQKGFFDGFDGKQMWYNYFLTENAKASVIIVHGYTEFIQKYYETIYYLLSEGYNVFIYDQRGHGLSARETDDETVCHCDSFKSYAKDLHCFIENIVKPNSEGLKINILSHSMGGMVSAYYLNEHHDAINKAVLSSPMIKSYTRGVPIFVMKKALEKKFIPATGLSGRFPPSHPFDPNPDFKKASDISYNRFKYNMDIRLSDKRYQPTGYSNAWMRDCIYSPEELLRKDFAAKITTECLVFTAGKDTVVNPHAEKKFADNLPNCKWILFPNAKHTIYNGYDEDIKRFYHEVFDFYRE